MSKATCIVFALVVAIAVLTEVKSKSLPSYIARHVCSRSDPKASQCLMNMIENLRPYLAKGMPEINVPGLEPLRIPEITITLDPKTVGVDTTTSVKAVARNIRCFGVSNFKLNKLKLDIDQFTYIVGVDFPDIFCNADYDIDARIINIPIRGHGPISGNGTNIKANAIIRGKLVDKDDGNHLKFKKIDVSIDVEDAKVNMGNLYQGETIITEALNILVNANSKLFIKAFTPIFETTVSKILIELGNAANDRIVYDEFFPA